MPYVNCPDCGVRSFVLAPWSAVGRCPTCEAPLSVPRQSVGAQSEQLPTWAHQSGGGGQPGRRERSGLH